MAQSFLGTGWTFPIQVAGAGGIRVSSGDKDIREAVGIILRTVLRERVMRPEFGAGIHTQVFEPNDANLAGRIDFLVRKVLERWEPRITLREVIIRRDAERIEIDVRYTIRATNREDNVVIPFFRGAFP